MENGFIGKRGEALNIPLKSVRINGNYTGLYGELTLEQLYVNDGNNSVEVIYNFPMPDKAVVSMFSVQVDDRTIVGELREKNEAFKAYDKAIRKSDSAYLLEQFRPNIFQVSLGRILPGEEIRIRIVYLETLQCQDGKIRISIPTLVAPRYIPGEEKSNKTGMGWSAPTGRVPDADFITPPVDRDADYRVELDLSFQPLLPVDEISSPSHDIRVDREEEGSIRITLADGTALLDRDIIILGCMQDEASSKMASWQDPETGEGYLYLNIFPDFGYRENKEARNYIFLIDISGSMNGSKLEQAKNSLQLSLRNLETGDSFNIVAFESDSHYFSREGSVLFNQDALDEAGRWIDALTSMGGTEIMEPVDFALKCCEGNSNSFILLFTDGQVGNESEIILQVYDRIKSNHLFTFGIDTNVNSYFINMLAEAGGGIPEYIYPGERLDDKVIRQFARINSPMLSNVRVNWSGLQDVEAYPQAISVVFDQEPLTIMAKFKGEIDGAVDICGSYNGEEFRVAVDLESGFHSETSFLRKHWGKMKIEHMEAMLEAINPRRRQSMEEEIVKMSIDYGVGSSQTSFVALQERVNKETGIPEAMVIPVAMADEWDIRLDSGSTIYESEKWERECRHHEFEDVIKLDNSNNYVTQNYVFADKETGHKEYSLETSLQEAVRCIAIKQMANGAFPPEKGAENEVLSTIEITAVATLSILLAADDPGMYQRQIEKSVNYLIEMNSEVTFSDFQLILIAAVYKKCLEKINVKKKMAELIRLELDKILLESTSNDVNAIEVLNSDRMIICEILLNLLKIDGVEEIDYAGSIIEKLAKLIGRAV